MGTGWVLESVPGAPHLAHPSQHRQQPREAPDSCPILHSGSEAELRPEPKPPRAGPSLHGGRHQGAGISLSPVRSGKQRWPCPSCSLSSSGLPSTDRGFHAHGPLSANPKAARGGRGK